MKTTLCIAGKNDIAVDVLIYCKKYFKDVNLICVCNECDNGINSWQKSLRYFAKQLNVKEYKLEDVYNIKDLVFISTEFDKIIKPSLFKSKKLYNIHFSLLPKYKGVYTSVMPILNGENETGVTLHKIDAGIDTGDLIAQKAFKIKDNDTSLDVYNNLIKHGTKLVISWLPKLLSGKFVVKPQPSVNSSYYSSKTIDYSNLTLDIRKTANEINRQVRAFSFRPYQLLTWNDNKYIECHITNSKSTLKPGSIIKDTDVYTKIATIDYDVILYKDNLDNLFNAIKKNNIKKVKEYLTAKSLINAKDEHGWAPITIAVYNNKFDIVKLLIKYGADINVVNNNGTTLLMYAKDCYLIHKDKRIFNCLVKKANNINQKDYYGKFLKEYCKEQNIILL